MPVDYAEIKDALNVREGHTLEILGDDPDIERYSVDHASQDHAQLRCSEVRGPGRPRNRAARVITVDLLRGTMRRAGTAEDVPLQLLAVL